MSEVAALHPINRRHLAALRGELGILQHANGATPDPAHGYCVDDAARALELDLLHGRQLGWAAVADSAELSLSYLEAALDERTGRFRNFRDIDGAWTEAPGSDDSVGRAMLALGSTIASVPDAGMRDRAITLFGRALRAAAKLKSPRAAAALILGLAAILRPTAASGERTPALAALVPDATALLGRLATDLHARFLWSAGPGWPWLESSLTYENALLPRALIVAGRQLKADVMVRIGLQVLDWLISVQTSPEGHFSPVGNGWWPRGGTKSQFDQQPIEATALLLAAEAAHVATDDPRYLAAMELAYGWFLGRNDLGRPVAVPSRGAGYDGLTPTGVNTNQGAESTLMWLTAVEHIRQMRADTAARAGVDATRPVASASAVRIPTRRRLPDTTASITASVTASAS